jgi:hypothetical protein
MDRPSSSRIAYLALLVVQIARVVLLTWIERPEFQQSLIHLGEQLLTPLRDDLLPSTAAAIMHGAYCFRLRRIPNFVQATPTHKLPIPVFTDPSRLSILPRPWQLSLAPNRLRARGASLCRRFFRSFQNNVAEMMR